MGQGVTEIQPNLSMEALSVYRVAISENFVVVSSQNITFLMFSFGIERLTRVLKIGILCKIYANKRHDYVRSTRRNAKIFQDLRIETQRYGS